jgi:hypothetical protein
LDRVNAFGQREWERYRQSAWSNRVIEGERWDRRALVPAIMHRQAGGVANGDEQDRDHAAAIAPTGLAVERNEKSAETRPSALWQLPRDFRGTRIPPPREPARRGLRAGHSQVDAVDRGGVAPIRKARRET